MSSDSSPEIHPLKHAWAGVFDRAAPTYDRVGPRFFYQLGQRAVALAQLPLGAKVLDVATGRGAMLFPAAQAVGPQGKVVGVDLSTGMVAATAQEVARLGLSANVEVHQMDAEHLQFPEATFDYLLCGFAVFFFPQLDQALAEFKRVLRPGGRLCVTTWTKVMSDQWAWFDDLAKAYLPPDPEPAADAPPAPVFDTVAGMTAIVQSAGFTNIQVFSETAEFVYASHEDLWATLWSHGMRGRLERIEQAAGPAGLQQFKAELFKGLDAMQTTGGLRQELPTLVTLATRPGG